MAAMETEANSSALVIGTDAIAGWLTRWLSGFQAHHRSCGPMWSKTS